MSNLNGASLESRNTNAEHKHRVRGFLNEKLAKFGVDCDNLHLTIVYDVIHFRVKSSQSLHQVGLDCLDRGHGLTYEGGTTAVFTESWAFEDQYRHRKLSFYDVEKMLSEMMDEAKYQWSK